jgi:hypothetical protein
MRLPRMTTRRWMALVAVVALAAGGIEWRRRQFLSLSKYHDSKIVVLRLPPDFEISNLTWLERDDGDGRVTRLNRQGIALDIWHNKLRIKYQRAARYPWLPVAPDPPEPK